MSENTNTLFWVITGAVIVLAVFLLINTSSNNSLSTINDTFSSYWTDAETNTPKEEIDEMLNEAIQRGKLLNKEEKRINTLFKLHQTTRFP